RTASRSETRTRAPRRSPLGHVAELLSLGQRAQLLQRLVLDLPDALACDVERAADLVQRAGRLAVQAEAHLEHPALPLTQHLERACERLVPHRQRGPLVWQRFRL